MTPVERAALDAAMQLPYPTFPCRGDKRPACPHGFKDAALPEAGLATLWARCPGTLVGVPTGESSGLAVLDIDRGTGGGNWYAQHRDLLPTTRIYRTRSGGLHLLFRHKNGLGSSASKIAAGVDVRARGGYVIWWPQQGFEVRNADHLVDWPEGLVDTPKRKPPETSNVYPFTPEGEHDRGSLDAKVYGIAKRVERASEGERNAVLYWAACRLAEMRKEGPLARLVSERWCTDLLMLTAERAGLTPQEAGRTIASGFGRAA